MFVDTSSLANLCVQFSDDYSAIYQKHIVVCSRTVRKKTSNLPQFRLNIRGQTTWLTGDLGKLILTIYLLPRATIYVRPLAQLLTDADYGLV